MVIRAKAPVRISFAGGGTDISPYMEEKGGLVINTTINKYAYATLIPRDDEKVIIKSTDLNCTVELSNRSEIEYDGNLDIVKAAISVLEIKRGFELILHADTSPGSGLGTSSTMTTAIIGTFDRWLHLNLNRYELAELAYKIEREEANIQGGKQDQYATAFGGVNYIEFNAGGTKVNRLKIKTDIIDELEYRLILYDTQCSRISSAIIKDQTANYIEKKEATVTALDTTRAIALEMTKAFLRGDIDEIGYLLDEGWQAKKKFSTKISNPEIDAIYKSAKKYGAIGGKLLGAGGGGYILFLCAKDAKCQMANGFMDHATPFAFEHRGMHTWIAR